MELALLCWDECSADCDGMTAIISYHLRKAFVPHTCIQGGLNDRTTGALVAPHFWICLDGEFLIDLRARKWLGDEESIPHGVFHPSFFPNVSYAGKPVSDIGYDKETLEAISDWTLDELEIPGAV
ncbi:hypothetical protein [Pseudovibrio sp. Ad37]|uniref:hypothetical protein n=1 Tax=Pseudovibrio sp. Ad37 TaxID=989422 RepID=UPI0012908504|nr:hypothetical protein [Pseudovibrio sp. Ad37]